MEHLTEPWVLAVAAGATTLLIICFVWAAVDFHKWQNSIVAKLDSQDARHERILKIVQGIKEEIGWEDSNARTKCLTRTNLPRFPLE